MNSKLGGDVYFNKIDGWSVSWESRPSYRHWCYQVLNPHWENLLVVMFNPGSLSGDGSDLSKDTTLRILREVCGAAELNPFVINLFDYAAPSPTDLFDNWHKRDPEKLIFDKIPLDFFKKFILAYGDYENWGVQDKAIKDRQAILRSYLSNLDEVDLPKNKTGTPKHPMVWQRQKLKPLIAALLRNSA